MRIPVWKDIEGYEGLYQVSDTGLVRSLNRVVGNRTLQGKILSLKTNTSGYFIVALCKEGKPKNFLVSRLVATAFLKEDLADTVGLEVCHLDGSRNNNHVENLRWDTKAGNQKDRVLHGTHCRGERSNTCKLTTEQAAEIKGLSYEGWTNQQLANKFGVSKTLVSNIKNQRRRLDIYDVVYR